MKSYQKLGDDSEGKSDGTNRVFSVFNPDQKYQYVLVFLTQLPPADDGNGGYKVSVNKIEVYGY
jgi:hypothetical protein